jgi:hypothetical protein
MGAHAGGTVCCLLQIQRGTSRLPAKPKMVGQRLGRYLTYPSLLSLRDASVQRRSPGKAKIMHNHISNQLMGKLVGIVSGLHEQPGLTGGLDTGKDLVLTALALLTEHREKQSKRRYTPSYGGDPEHVMGDRRKSGDSLAHALQDIPGHQTGGIVSLRLQRT